MDIPWQLCQTIGPLLSQRFPLASAKAQPRGGGGLYCGVPGRQGPHVFSLITSPKVGILDCDNILTILLLYANLG